MLLKLWHDFRFALRQIRKAPGFALATVLTLALGIGATTTMFSVVNAVLLQPLPFPEPDRLVAAGSVDSRRPDVTNSPNAMSYPDFFDWRSQNQSFTGLAAYHDTNVTLTGAGDPKNLDADVVSADFFKILGVEPAMGRGVRLEDEKPGVHVAILSHQLWQSAFGSSSDIVGRSITLDNNSYTVIGVMPRGFEFPIQNPAPMLWTSIADDTYDPSGEPMTSERGDHLLSMVGRLRPGVSVEQANADVNVIAQRLFSEYPKTNSHFARGIVIPQIDALVGDSRPALRILFAAVALVLLIACANVAGLLLARGSRRSWEVAVRSALGASRIQIVRQMLVESLVLSLLGGLAGVALSGFLVRVVVGLLPSDLPRSGNISIDATVLAFAVAVSFLIGPLFGVLPALRVARVDPSTALRDGTRTATTGRGQHRLHNSLVVAEIAVGLVLLIGSGLLIRSFLRVLQVDPGFDRRNVLIASLALPDRQYPHDQQLQFYGQLLSRLRGLPGVVSVSTGWPMPLSADGMRISFDIEGHPLPEGQRNTARASIAAPDYFKTLRIPVLQGREFQETDTDKSMPVVIVNQAFAKQFFPGEAPIGKHITPGLSDGTVKEVPRQIIAVVGDVRAARLTDEARPEYYVPFTQAAILSPRLVIRTSLDPVSLIPSVRTQVAQLDKNLPLFEVHTLQDSVTRSAAQQRFQALLLSSFAAVALLLCIVGLYGLLSYLVTQRTLEIGLRIALGAQRGNVLRMILSRGMSLACIGVGIGVLASFAMTNVMRKMLYGVRPLDAATFVAVSAVLLLVALAACSAPAYRAARLDPVKTLRDQ